jgi:hypothetical protein
MQYGRSLRSSRLHGVTSQKIVFFVATAVRAKKSTGWAVEKLWFDSQQRQESVLFHSVQTSSGAPPIHPLIQLVLGEGKAADV